MAPRPSPQAAQFAERVRHTGPFDAGTPVPPAPALLVARRHRATLSGAIHALELALAAPAADPEWRESVSIRLHSLRLAFTEHIVLTEGSDGLYAELLDHAPRLARTVYLLTREHTAIAATLSHLQCGLGSSELSIEELRDWAGDLLRELARHRQRGADLVYEAYETDIGGET
ncbi:hypothetical protein [Micromonospora sp. NPDC049679]|uniref:hypothetical protein n=1 Tax=Micromonospora sp. NPDC049679 TaxID=3155920 RepID=UPI0033F4C399